MGVSENRSLAAGSNVSVTNEGSHEIYTPTLRVLCEYPKKPLAKRREPDSTDQMIRPGFLDSESRQDLTELARDGSAAHRLARRANALERAHPARLLRRQAG